MRVLHVGMSRRDPCGVRDYATRIGGGLDRLGMETVVHWYQHASGLPFREWLLELDAQVREQRPDAVVWHYSVSAHGYRGIPTAVGPLAVGLGRAPAPVLLIMHEFAFPWGRHGWRGRVWSATHRLVLPAVMATASAVIVTVDERAEWLTERWWLPSRPTSTVPVVSNVPLPPADAEPQSPMRLGMFGYPHVVAGRITTALGRLRQHDPVAELWLIGAPGPNSKVGCTWREAAAQAGCAGAVQFTGILGPKGVSGALARCHLLVFDDGGGPSPRKTTLAACLATGRPVVAVDGPNTWSELIDAGAVRLARPDPASLTAALRELVSDPRIRRQLGRRGRAFHDRELAVDVVAEQVAEVVRAVGGAATAGRVRR